ncbi:MAG: uracil phosphoribosyltransferase [Christensenellaceae bacterium]|jgi:uracil phosphoribosyltransferase|nr:uracil phosphoribosyltransferase [Christensenellaceae bacterium]
MDKTNVKIIKHPLLSHKVALLRDYKTSTKEFRELVEEISVLMGYEALRDLPLQTITVKTPLEECRQDIVCDDCVAIIPILRAGLGMVEGILKLIPTAKIGHIGLYRDHDTCKPIEYYCKLPEKMNKKTAIIVDPMLATGQSVIKAISLVKASGCQKIKLISIIAAPEGIDAVSKAHPDVLVYLANQDRKLNEKYYILPGLGDAGDRIFGTE